MPPPVSPAPPLLELSPPSLLDVVLGSNVGFAVGSPLDASVPELVEDSGRHSPTWHVNPEMHWVSVVQVVTQKPSRHTSASPQLSALQRRRQMPTSTSELPLLRKLPPPPPMSIPGSKHSCALGHVSFARSQVLEHTPLMQSASPRVLELLDRTHDPERAPAAVAEARAAGFGHVSLDLIYGTPGERPQDWQRTVDTALACDVDHLSAYALGVEDGTKLAARVRRGELTAPRGDEAAERYDVMDVRCSGAGLDWYEISNWATGPGARCRHNLLYWRNHHWWGVGPGTHSHVGGVRWWNHDGLDQWQDALATGGSPAAGHEVLTAAQRRLEGVLVGIRLAEGLDLDATDRRDALPSLVDDGLVRLDDDRVVLTRPGRLLADLVVRRLTA